MFKPSMTIRQQKEALRLLAKLVIYHHSLKEAHRYLRIRLALDMSITKDQSK